MSFQEDFRGKIRERLSSFFDERKKRYNYLDRQTGEFNNAGVLILNSLASCFHIPILFYISLFTIGISDKLDVFPVKLLSVLFFACAISVLFDIMIGFIYDKMIKQQRQTFQKVLSIIGTIGFVVTLFYYFDDNNKETALKQFRLTYIGMAAFLALANCNHVKNSFNYAPSQESRKNMMFLELIISSLFLTFLCMTPFLYKLTSDDCNCAGFCTENSGSDDCLKCVRGCGKINNFTIVETSCIIFTVVAGLANIIQLFVVETRNDEKYETIVSTFNTRVLDFFKNKFIVQTTLLEILESFMLFGFAFWVYYFLFVSMGIDKNCVSSHADGPYVCTKAFILEMAFIILLAVAIISYFISRKGNFMTVLWVGAPILTLIVGIVGIAVSKFGNVEAILVAITVFILYCAKTMTKLFYSDASTYDEYLTGQNQPYFLSSVYILATKIGFLLAVALQYSLLDPEFTTSNNQEKLTNHNLEGFSIVLLVCSGTVIFIKSSLLRYNLNAFDKIHLAIERNHSEQEDITFYDPVAKETISKPLISFEPQQKNLICLLRNLTKADQVSAINGKHEKLQKKSLWYGITICIFTIIDTLLIIVYGEEFDTLYSWYLFIGLILLPFFLLGMIYNYNVWATSTRLASSKYMNIDREFLLRVANILQKEE